MAYPFDGRTYPRFLDLFYHRFDVPLAKLPAPPRLETVPGQAQPPLGYLGVGDGDERRFVPDPERAPLITRAFRQVAEGTGFQKVWRAAVAEGLMGRSGCRISASGLLHMLRNPAYMGLLRYGQELYSAEVGLLVSESTFKRTFGELDRQVTAFHAAKEERDGKHFGILLCARELEREPRQRSSLRRKELLNKKTLVINDEKRILLDMPVSQRLLILKNL